MRLFYKSFLSSLTTFCLSIVAFLSLNGRWEEQLFTVCEVSEDLCVQNYVSAKYLNSEWCYVFFLKAKSYFFNDLSFNSRLVVVFRLNSLLKCSFRHTFPCYCKWLKGNTKGVVCFHIALIPICGLVWKKEYKSSVFILPSNGHDVPSWLRGVSRFHLVWRYVF